jgi:hypothetical protein
MVPDSTADQLSEANLSRIDLSQEDLTQRAK